MMKHLPKRFLLLPTFLVCGIVLFILLCQLHDLIESGSFMLEPNALQIFTPIFLGLFIGLISWHFVSSSLSEKKKYQRLKQIHYAFSKTAFTLPNSHSEIELLNNICHFIVETAGYRLAWIGYAQNDLEKSVKPVAGKGFEEGYLDSIKICWSDSLLGQGPTGTAIRTGQSVTCKNIFTDQKFLPWRQEALKRGYSSSIAIPLKSGKSIFGSVNIYSSEPDAFDSSEKALLEELVSFISLGVERHRIDEKRVYAEASLTNVEEMYRLIFENASDAIILADPEAEKILDCSPSAETLFKRPKSELVGLPLSVLSPPEKTEEYKKAFAQLITKKQPFSVRDIEIINKSGEIIPVNIATSCTILNGKMIIAGFFRDISDRIRSESELRHREETIRQSLKEKEVLLREIHHRVKNNLQVISSLLRLQDKFSKDPNITRVLNDIQLRIQAMATAHEKLCGVDNLAFVKANEYLESLISHWRIALCKPEEITSIHTAIDDFVLNIDSAISIGFIVTELVTNSLKHAFPNDRKGNVWIIFKRLKNGQYELSIRDDGIGLPHDITVNGSKSLGLDLVKIFTSQLNGKIEQKTGPGATYCITFDKI